MPLLPSPLPRGVARGPRPFHPWSPVRPPVVYTCSQVAGRPRAPGAARSAAGWSVWRGGRGPHDQSIANDARNVARSGRAEGRTGSVRASGWAVHGPFEPPPPPLPPG